MKKEIGKEYVLDQRKLQDHVDEFDMFEEQYVENIPEEDDFMEEVKQQVINEHGEKIDDIEEAYEKQEEDDFFDNDRVNQDDFNLSSANALQTCFRFSPYLVKCDHTLVHITVNVQFH